AAAVVGGPAVAEAVDSLADKSLVYVSQEIDDATRFTMLEVVREYATEHLDDRADAQRPPAAYLAEPAHRRPPRPNRPAHAAGVEWREGGDGKVGAGVDWAITAGADGSDVAGRLCAGLWRFWRDRGFFHEGRRWLTAALACQEQMSTSVRAAALNGAGVLALL